MNDTLAEKLERFGALIESRHAEDFLQHLIDHFSGHFGSWLVAEQMEADHKNGCPHCEDDLDADLIGE